MKKFAILSLVVCFGVSLASSALALRWPDNASRRVGAMGNAYLAIEDETTALTIFNHQNIAGVALNEKENRLDLGLGVMSSAYSVEDTGYSYDATGSGFEFTRPGAEYRGLTYWLGDSLVMRGGIEFMSQSMKDELTSGGATADEGIGLFGIGGGASLGYKLDNGLAFGAGLSYMNANGKPDDLEGDFDVYGGGNTSKVEMNASMLTWGVGAGWALEINDKNKLTFGLYGHSDDDMPDAAGLAAAISGGSVSPFALGDYNVTLTTEGTVGGDAASSQTDYTQSPLGIGFEAIYNFASMLEAGVLVDYCGKSVNYAYESTMMGTTSSTDYKIADVTELGVTEVIQANIPVGEGMAVLPGIFNSMVGSYYMDTYALDGTTTDPDDTYNNSNIIGANNTFGIGCGFQAMEKQLQVALQYEMGSWAREYTYYNPSGTSVASGDTDGSVSNLRIGAEYWVMPILALRAGYQILSDTTNDVVTGYDPVTFDPIYEDVTSTTGRITLGVGLNLTSGMIFDLLVQLDTNTEDPASDPEPSDTAMDIFLGCKIPL